MIQFQDRSPIQPLAVEQKSGPAQRRLPLSRSSYSAMDFSKLFRSYILLSARSKTRRKV